MIAAMNGLVAISGEAFLMEAWRLSMTSTMMAPAMKMMGTTSETPATHEGTSIVDPDEHLYIDAPDENSEARRFGADVRYSG